MDPGSNPRQCDHIWQYFAHFGNILKDFVNILNSLFANCYAIGKIFIVVNGQISKK